MKGVPEVSVVIAVYNTMPYLTTCLESLVKQTIGFDRVQVVLVDDGSSDGSEVEVDRFAAAHPENVIAIHQPNSGGPAAPTNRALDVATGRYVYPVGADDYLGEEALERLVRAADEWESDVVVGKVVGVGERSVNQRLFSQGTQSDADPFKAALPYNLADVKLFRRSLIERLDLRYPENIRARCDQPFTFTAFMNAKRISILTDYDYYFAVRRDDESNVTYSTSPDEELASAEAIMGTIAEQLEPGERRDYYMLRQFHWELSALLKPGFLELAGDDQRRIAERIGGLADSYLTQNIKDRMYVRDRLRIVLAQKLDLPVLHAVIRSIEEFSRGGPLTFVVEGGRVFARYPGFGDGAAAAQDYEILGERLTGRLTRRLLTHSVNSDGSQLVVKASIGIVGLEDSMVVALLTPIAKPSAAPLPRIDKPATGIPCSITLSPGADGDSTDLRISIDAGDLNAVDDTIWSLRLRVELRGASYDLPVPRAELDTSIRTRRGLRTVTIETTNGRGESLVVTKNQRQGARSIIARARPSKQG